MTDLLVKNGMVFTYIHEGYHALKLRRADVLIENGAIAKIGHEIKASCESLDAEACLVLPGMINIGSNAISAKLLSGLLPDKNTGCSGGTLLHTRVLPMLDLAAGMLTGEEAEAIALCSLWEGLAGGTTTAVDMCRPDFTAAIKKAGEKLRMRLFTAPTAADRESPELLADGTLKLGKSVPAQNQTGDFTAIYSLETASDPLVREMAGFSGPRFAYAACSSLENDAIRRLSEIGFLADGTVLQQCVLAGEKERELISSAGGSAAISAVGCVQEGKAYPGVNFLRSSVNTALTTGYYGNCMMAEMRAAAFSAKQSERDAGQYQATDAFYAATVAGARALKRQDTLGRIDVGMCGDISVVCMERLAPLSYPFIQYLYGANPSDVKHVVCGGGVVKKDFLPTDDIFGEIIKARANINRALPVLWREAIKWIL